MRRVTAGLGSLAIAAGLATTVALERGRRRRRTGQPISGADGVATSCRIPAEEKRRELREVALQKVLAGQAKVREARRAARS